MQRQLLLLVLPLTSEVYIATYSTQSLSYVLTSDYIDYKTIYVIVDDILLEEGVGYTVDREGGIVTLNTAAELGGQSDNVLITFF